MRKTGIISLGLGLTFICLLSAFAKGSYHIDAKNRVIGQPTFQLPTSSFSNLRLKTIDAKLYSLEKLKRPVVLVFTSTQCLVANQYTPRLNQMHQTYPGVALFGTYANQDDSITAIAKHVDKMQIIFPVVKDFDGRLAKRVEATMTPQAFLINQDGQVCYAGAIDDNRYANSVRETYLTDALNQLLEGKQILVPQAKSFGCTIHFSQSSSEEVTYARHIAPILQRNCQICHRPDQVAPFSLLTYQEAKTWSTEIVTYTQNRRMPPWKAAPGYGEFKRERRMQDWEIVLLAEWTESEMLEGKKEELPIPIAFYERMGIGPTRLNCRNARNLRCSR